MTSCPAFTQVVPSALPTLPEPMTPIFIVSAQSQRRFCQRQSEYYRGCCMREKKSPHKAGIILGCA